MSLLNFQAAVDQPFFLISGPCVIVSESLAMETAPYSAQVTADLGINFIYKSSFDQANRTSADSFRGLGMADLLKTLQDIDVVVTNNGFLEDVLDD